jgi:hypothetical protein
LQKRFTEPPETLQRESRRRAWARLRRLRAVF